MPIYGYICTECSHEVEVRQSFTDPPMEICEVCKGRLRRVIHPVGIMFKGKGFYSTDARSDAARAKKAAAGKKKSDSSPNKSETKSESSSSDVKPVAPKKTSGESAK